MDVVGAKHPHGGGGEREIVGEIGLIVAQRDHRGDFHSIGGRVEPESEFGQRILKPDDDDSSRPDQSDVPSPFHHLDEGEARREHRDKSRDIEHADGAAREIAGRLRREAERQRAKKGQIPDGKAVGELATARAIDLEAVLAVVDARGDHDRAEDHANRRRRFDRRHASERDNPIERARRRRGANNRHSVDQRRQIGEPDRCKFLECA
jgi:hypothetical protein